MRAWATELALAGIVRNSQSQRLHRMQAKFASVMKMPVTTCTQRGWIGDTRYLLTVASDTAAVTKKGQGHCGLDVAMYNRKPVLINGQQDTDQCQYAGSDER